MEKSTVEIASSVLYCYRNTWWNRNIGHWYYAAAYRIRLLLRMVR